MSLKIKLTIVHKNIPTPTISIFIFPFISTFVMSLQDNYPPTVEGEAIRIGLFRVPQSVQGLLLN